MAKNRIGLKIAASLTLVGFIAATVLMFMA